ncbi:PREDICTED: E3 ubiquitin-protein ligase RNF4-like [Tarenaya hassleriana]|uniref:E3 ubiquitin-protein ligase RNF4-like n=1 Tax=Tarenaya hassleriana TaxID=28532 RepID=UPI00053C9A86|nr:PREDICTED: E3 ubiquitin-protein ligase RNF4-like [Tarenaya hassleriana]
MDTQGGRGVRGHRRRKAVIDLNALPTETRIQEGTSNSGNARGITVGNNPGESAPVPSPPPPTVDVVSIDEDVVESSASAFAEAKNKSRGARQRPVMIDVDSGCTSGMPANISNKRRMVPPNQQAVDRDDVVVLAAPEPQPPQEEPKFTCPICMSPFTQETSTKCGHIFCKECIRTAISSQHKCPTCRKKVLARDLIRVFLPATR